MHPKPQRKYLLCQGSLKSAFTKREMTCWFMSPLFVCLSVHLFEDILTHSVVIFPKLTLKHLCLTLYTDLGRENDVNEVCWPFENYLIIMCAI